MLIKDYDEFIYESKTMVELASELKFNGISGSYELTIFNDGYITLKYLPSEIHLPFNEIKENIIEKTNGESGKLYQWILTQFSQHMDRVKNNG